MIARRRPFPVKRPNWEYRCGSPPVCTIHNEEAIWHKNKARESGGQWACKSCSRNKARGQKRAWKKEHTDPVRYNIACAVNTAKCHSKKIGRPFEITTQDVLNLWIAQDGKCAITDIKMDWLPGNGERNRNKVTMDRIDSSKGYVAGNVWLVCEWANRAKTDMTKEEAITFAKGIIRVFGDCQDDSTQISA